MQLASAYAADRITRQVFLETLNVFVRHFRSRIGSPNQITPEHLVGLGIPAAVANRLPLKDAELDIWLVTGLFNGVIDPDDFNLLMDPSKKGQFLQKHFAMTYEGTERSRGDLAFGFATQYSPLLWTDNTYRSGFVQSRIREACAQLEEGPMWYTASVHYMLGLAAASLNGRPLELIGPFQDETEVLDVFAQVFDVVGPDFDDTVALPRRFHETFTFDESAVIPRKTTPIAQRPTPAASSCIIA